MGARGRQIYGTQMPYGPQKALLHTCAAETAHHPGLIGQDATM